MPDRPTTRLDRADLVDLLATFETEWERATGEYLPTEDFYVEYRAGRHDSVFTMAWASYYEALERSSGERREELTAIVEEGLPPLVVA